MTTLDTNQFLDDYIGEASDCLTRIFDGLLKMDEGDLTPYIVVARDLHTLKGLSACLGFEDVAHLCHQIEDCLVAAVEQSPDQISEPVNSVITACDVLEMHTASLREGSSLPTIPDFSNGELRVDLQSQSEVDHSAVQEACDNHHSRRKSIRFLSDVCEVTVYVPTKIEVLNESFGGIGLSFTKNQNYEIGQEVQINFKGCFMTALVRWTRIAENGRYQVGFQWKV